MSQLKKHQIEAIKEAVRKSLSEIAAGLHSQYELGLSPETEYAAGYCDGQEGCSEIIYEMIDEILGEIDQAVVEEVAHDVP